MERAAGCDWLVVRYDDNGNEVILAEVASEAAARSIAETFEARGHKQTYFALHRADYHPPRRR